MIRLGVDSRDMFAAEPRGTGRALTALLRHLLPLVPDWRVTLYTDRVRGPHDLGGACVKAMDIRGSRLEVWERVRLPLAALTDRLDLLHCPSQTGPPVAPCPVVLTVHDLIPLKVPGETTEAEARRFGRALAWSARRARRIITVSEYTKRDLVSTLGVPETRIDVVRWGVTPPAEMPAPSAVEASLRQLGVTPPFFVAFGGEAPRKNVARLLEAVVRFTREVTADVRLVLVGASGPARGRFQAQAESLGIGKSVVPLGYLPEGDVARLLARAEALVYPSLYEGFGLPILEAMAAGAPVITSGVTSMPEVAGGAALLVDPTDAGAIADAMRTCYLNEAVKSELRARGRRRAAAFTWDETARGVLATYRRALG